VEPSNTKLHIIGFCGSLRRNSYNRGLLRSAERQLPENAQFTLANISVLPFFNEDLENSLPESVVKLRELAKSADAVVISTPEYNLSISSVLKNALEWLSRQSLGRPIAGKPVAIMGATPLAIGTSQAQAHLRDILFGLNMHLVNRPIVMVGNAIEKFEKEGNLIDATTEQLIGLMIRELIICTEQEKTRHD